MAKAENTVIFDGIKYNPGDELPDLGSWVCTDARGMVRDYEGLSKDVSKLPHYVQSGSSALCMILDRKSTRLNSSHPSSTRMPSSA